MALNVVLLRIVQMLVDGFYRSPLLGVGAIGLPLHRHVSLWRLLGCALRPIALAHADIFLPASSASLPLLVGHALWKLARPLRVVGLESLDCGDERAAAVAYLGVPRRGGAREAAPVGEGAADLDLRAVELPVAVARAVV